MITRWRRSPTVLVRRTLTATVVLGSGPEPLRLRGTAQPLWEALAEGGTSTELAARVAGTTVEAVVSDLERALTILADAGAVDRF